MTDQTIVSADDRLPTPDGAATGATRPTRGLRAFGSPPRVMGVDVARGIAVVGMIGAHIGVTESFDWARVATWTDLVHGRSSLLFALVAGISIALLTGGRTPPRVEAIPRARLMLLGRGAAVFVLGLGLELLSTGIAVILTVYGVLFVVVIPFLRWRRRSLVLTAGVLALLGPLVLAVVWLLTLGASGPGLDLVVFGTYPVTVWLSLLLAGMAIGRSDLFSRRTAVTLLVVGAAVSTLGYGVAGLTGRSGASPGSGSSSSSSFDEEVETVPGSTLDLDGWTCDSWSDWATCWPDDGLGASDASGGGTSSGSGASGSSLDDLPVFTYLFAVADLWPEAGVADSVLDASPHSGGTAEILGSGGLAAAIVGACLLLSRPLRWAVLPLAALGSMPLTAYTAHVVVIAVVFGLAGTATDDVPWLVLSLSLVVGSLLWVQFVGRGPLERLAGAAARAMAGSAGR